MENNISFEQLAVRDWKTCFMVQLKMDVHSVEKLSIADIKKALKEILRKYVSFLCVSFVVTHFDADGLVAYIDMDCFNETNGYSMNAHEFCTRLLQDTVTAYVRRW